MSSKMKTIVVVVVIIILAVLIGAFMPSSTILNANNITITYSDEIDLSNFSITEKRFGLFPTTISVSVNQIDYDPEFIGTQTASFKYNNLIETFDLTINPKQLDQPIISYVNGVVQWSNSSNISSYSVNINNVDYEALSNSYNLESFNLETGTLIIKVKANTSSNKYSNSEYSNILEISKLVAPDTLLYTNGKIEWNSIEGAQKYNLWINSVRYETNTNSYTFSNFREGNNTIKIQTVGGPNTVASAVYETTFSKLFKVSNVEYDGTRITWDSVNTNANYRILIDDNEYTSTQKFLEITLDNNREYDINITALAKTNVTIDSDSYITTIERKLLATPSATITLGSYSNTYNLNVLPVDNANSYTLVVTLYIEEESTSTTYILTNNLTKEIVVDLLVTKIEISVIAKDTTNEYGESTAFITNRSI